MALLLGLIVLATIRASGLWNRMLAANLAVTVVVAAIVLVALETGASMYLDIAFAFALLGFIGTLFFARFLSGRGRF